MTTDGADSGSAVTLTANNGVCPRGATGAERPQAASTVVGSQGCEPYGTGTRASTSCSLRPSWDSIPAARDFATATLRRWGLTTLMDAVELVVSELVTNALRHGLALDPLASSSAARRPVPTTTGVANPIELRLMRNGPRVVCVINDPSNDIPVCKPLGDMPGFGDPLSWLDDSGETEDCGDLEGLAEAGHGLHLVSAYSRRWGWAHLTGGGKAVWAMFHPTSGHLDMAG